MFTNTQPNKLFYPTFNQSRGAYQPFPRPQTPHALASSNLQPSLNRSLSRLNPQNHGNPVANYNNPSFPHRNSISRSRVSMGGSQASHLSNLVNEPDIFPEELVFLLRNEQKNINKLKEKMQREKARVENDFAVFRAEMDHIVQDVKLSVQAELDSVYKAYITKYAELKGEVQELRLMRKEILMNSQGPYSPTNPAASTSNKDLISQIQKDAEHMRNFRVYGYLGQLQKQKLEPITQLANELLMVGLADCPFYKHKEMTATLKDAKMHFASTIKAVFQALQQYVMTPESLLQRQRTQFENSKTLLRELDPADSTKMRPFDIHYPANSQEMHYPANSQETHYPANWQGEERTAKDLRGSKDTKKTSRMLHVGSNQQTCITRWCDQVRLNKIQKVQTDHQDSILCIHFVADKYVATGSKDHTVNVYSLDGKKLTNLKGHKAAICCLALIKGASGDLLASGSDNGCGSVILWDIKSWQAVGKIQAHEAAVTSIVDLQDGRHIASGSYDKKINIFSMAKNQRVLSLNNRSSVTGLVLSSDKSRLVAAGLDKSVSVWSIVRKNGAVEDIVNEKTIACDELVCQLQPSLLRPNVVYCACRDGTLRVLNILSGVTQKSFTVNANSLIELIAIEREMNAESPVLISCSCKDNALVVTKMDNGLSSLAKVAGGLGIDYGCGIGPKVVLSGARDGMVAIVSQRKDNREFSLFELELK